MKRGARARKRNAKNRTRAKWRKVAEYCRRTDEAANQTFDKLRELTADVEAAGPDPKFEVIDASFTVDGITFPLKGVRLTFRI